jgi:hypothetical protein
MELLVPRCWASVQPAQPVPMIAMVGFVFWIIFGGRSFSEVLNDEVEFEFMDEEVEWGLEGVEVWERVVGAITATFED